MKVATELDDAVATAGDEPDESELRPRIEHVSPDSAGLPSAGVVVGELVAVTDEGRTPLVVYAGQKGSAAVRARTTIDLHGADIGRQVVLVFENCDRTAPIVTGVLRQSHGWPSEQTARQVEVDVDGERLIVSAAEQLVLRCGKSSITLTRAGKILIQGSYILSRSSGVNRVKGGSVQLN